MSIIQQLLDFNEHEIIQYIPVYNFCQKLDLNMSVDLKEIYEKFKDHNSGLIDYQGVLPIPFDQGTNARTFRIHPYLEGEGYEYLYYS